MDDREPLPPMPPGWMPATEEQVAAFREDINTRMLPVSLDLAYLARHGVLAGVAEIIAERRRQVEAKGCTPERDDAHIDGQLVGWARSRVYRLGVDRIDGTADPATDGDRLREAGALLAAEIDRLNRMRG